MRSARLNSASVPRVTLGQRKLRLEPSVIDKLAAAACLGAATTVVVLMLSATHQSRSSYPELRYTTSIAPQPQPRYSYPGPPQAKPIVSQLCRDSPNGNRVCCLGREPRFEARRVLHAGFVRTHWRLYCA